VILRGIICVLYSCGALSRTKRLVDKTIRQWGDTWVVGLIHEFRSIGAKLDDPVQVEVMDHTIVIRKKKNA